MVFSNKKPPKEVIERPKKCPFCGSVDIQTNKFDADDLHAYYCIMCGARGGYSSTKDGALAKWNRRDG